MKAIIITGLPINRINEFFDSTVDFFTKQNHSVISKVYPEVSFNIALHETEINIKCREIIQDAKVSNADVVIIKTQNEHVLNAFRVARMSGDITNLLVNFIWPTSVDNIASCTCIDVDDDGNLSSWPRFMFDQLQRDFAEIVELKRKRLNLIN